MHPMAASGALRPGCGVLLEPVAGLDSEAGCCANRELIPISASLARQIALASLILFIIQSFLLMVICSDVDKEDGSNFDSNSSYFCTDIGSMLAIPASWIGRSLVNDLAQGS
jgi:hypothetical protein